MQKQVKETLARLTAKDKGQKKAAKWRKEKREANAEARAEAAAEARAESRVLKLTEFVTANDLALLMAHLFVLIRYGFGIEATKNLTPGCEPTTEEAWDAMDSEKMVSQP